MKKLLAVLLSLAMVLSFAACGNTEQPSESTKTFSDTIPIGDGVEDINIKGACYGTYEIIDEDYDYLAEGEEAVCYYDGNCDTPYIEVYSIDKNGMSLEEYTKMRSEKYSSGYYQMIDNFGYYTGPWEDEDGFYYFSSLVYEGEKQFHTVCFSAKTEELHLGDNLYMWVPTGYSETDAGVGETVFSAKYDESYALPYFLVMLDDNSYESTLNYYSFNGEPDFTEEQYNEWNANVTEESTNAFFEGIGFKVLKSMVVECDAGDVYGLILDNQRIPTPYSAIAYVPTTNGSNYRINLWCEGEMPAYPYLYTVMKSVHTKGESTKNVSEIDLGGGFGIKTLEGNAYGTYKVIETPEKFVYENTKTTVYEDLNCDTPYIIVYRFAKGDFSLENFAQYEADTYSNGYYQTFEDPRDGSNGACIFGLQEFNGNKYYASTVMYEDGDDFVEISYYGKTEEIQIGDTNVYVWVPVGYTSHMDDDFKAHGSIFYGKYSDDYYCPNIFVGKWEFTYDYLKWYFGEDFLKESLLSEEEHVKLVERIKNGEDVMHEFYTLLGDTIVFDSYEAGESYDNNAGYYVLEGGKSEGTEAWFEINGDWYVVWLESDFNPKPAYATTFLSSLHTK